MAAVPLLGWPTEAIVSESPSTSVSFASTEMVTALSCPVVAESSTAFGGSLTGVTVIVALAGEPAAPSLSVTSGLDDSEFRRVHADSAASGP